MKWLLFAHTSNSLWMWLSLFVFVCVKRSQSLRLSRLRIVHWLFAKRSWWNDGKCLSLLQWMMHLGSNILLFLKKMYCTHFLYFTVVSHNIISVLLLMHGMKSKLRNYQEQRRPLTQRNPHRKIELQIRPLFSWD